MTGFSRRAAIGGVAAGAVAMASAASAQQARPMAGRFSGKFVAVTGATSGIGRAAAEKFAAEGAKVTFCGRREELGKEVEAGVRKAGGEATFIRADVRSDEEVEAFFRRTAELYGGLDAAVNNAGMQTIGEIDKETPENFATMLDTNVTGVWRSVRSALPLLRARGGGSIINIASIHAFASRPRLSGYSATKGAVMAMTRSLALELGPDRIRVNAVCPGPVDTAMLRGFAKTEEARNRIAEGVWGMKRLGAPEEAAGPILWLASDESTFVTGAAFTVDGGTLAAI